MIAILTAIIVTIVAILDYAWPHLEQKTTKPENLRLVKFFILAGLLVLSWALAIFQIRADRKSDNDREYMRTQLDLANKSLTNSTAVIKGLAVGGDSQAKIEFAYDAGDAMGVYMSQSGEYPIRSLGVKITELTKRLNAESQHSTNVPPEGPVLYQNFFGDVARWTTAPIYTLNFDPAITNYYRFDVIALNGSYWEIMAFNKIDTNWAMRLVYRWSRVGDKVEILPPSMKGSMLVY